MSDSRLTCAILTPAGRGAIAVVAVFGKKLDQAEALVETLFESFSGRQLSRTNRKVVLYGRWKPTDEDVVVFRLEDRVEIHCHGGQVAPASILKSLVQHGVHEVDMESASLLLEKSLWLSELKIAMSQATTERTAMALLSQYHRAPKLIADLNDMLQSAEAERLIQQLDRMLDMERFGSHLTAPWSVVLCGRPNVGKSSLINAFVGFERAIVHEIAGTTRDVVTQLTAVEGWPVELKDTAGLRETEDMIEKQGVAFSQLEIDQADLVIAVFDASQLNRDADWTFAREVGASIVVVNKIDLFDPTSNETASILDDWQRAGGPDDGIVTMTASTIDKTGIDELVGAMARQLVSQEPGEDQLIPVSPKQVEFLTRLRVLVEQRDWESARQLVNICCLNPIDDCFRPSNSNL